MGCVWGGLRMELQTMWRRPLSQFMLVWDRFLHLDGFHNPLPEPFASSQNCDTISVDTMVCLLNMNCNAVLGVSSSHCLSELSQSNFQCSLAFFHIHLRGITGNLMHHSCLFLLWGPIFICIRSLFMKRVFNGLKTGFTARGVQTFLIL